MLYYHSTHTTTLQHSSCTQPIFSLLTNVKGKDKPEDRPGAVYKINCSEFQATYIGETGRNLTTRLTEHKRATKRVTSAITLPNTT